MSNWYNPLYSPGSIPTTVPADSRANGEKPAPSTPTAPANGGENHAPVAREAGAEGTRPAPGTEANSLATEAPEHPEAPPTPSEGTSAVPQEPHQNAQSAKVDKFVAQSATPAPQNETSVSTALAMLSSQMAEELPSFDEDGYLNLLQDLAAATSPAAGVDGTQALTFGTPQEAMTALLATLSAEFATLAHGTDVTPSVLRTIHGLLGQSRSKSLTSAQAGKSLRIAAWMLDAGGMPASSGLARNLADNLGRNSGGSSDGSTDEYQEPLATIFGAPASGQPVSVATLESAPPATLARVSAVLQRLMISQAPTVVQLGRFRSVLQGIFGDHPGTPSQIANEAAALQLSIHEDKFVGNVAASHNAAVLNGVLQDIQTLAEDSPTVVEQALST